MINRMKSLGVHDVHLGVEHKIGVFEKYLSDNQLDPSEVVYMGDDIPDFHVMKLAAVPVCPADAAEEIKSISKYISHYEGGKGCVRDIIEQVLKLQNKWMDDEAFKW
jgi:3-deoxy-D-manno-octulosonate 8-phosphate phosphatase (KDO 8-P phosphatase)